VECDIALQCLLIVDSKTTEKKKLAITAKSLSSKMFLKAYFKRAI